MDMATSAVASQQAQVRTAIATAVLKKQHEMDMSLVAMIEAVAKSAPPPGQGTAVDVVA